jgi:dGTPase
LDIPVKKSDWRIFSIGKDNTKTNMPKEWGFDWFWRNANGFFFLTASRPGIEGGLRISYATLGALWNIQRKFTKKTNKRHCR